MRAALQGLLTAGVMAGAMLAPADASAAPCAGGSTAWNGGSGSFNEDSNWSNGGPSSSCEAVITAPGTYTVSMTSGANMKSLRLGGAGSSPTLVISAVNANTNLNATTTGIDIEPGASVVLTCPALPAGCNTDPTGGGASLNSGDASFANEGTITVAAASGTGASIVGPLVNEGTVQINQSTRLNDGAVINQGAIGIADGKILTSKGDSCGDTSVSLANDSGGSISAAGTGALSVVNYEQGDGTTSGTLPVTMPCGGTLEYSGSGTSAVRAEGGIHLSGEIKANQQLTVSAASPNTIASVAGGAFTNHGSITLTCPAFGCSGGPGGGAELNANGSTFTNAGTLTVASSSETGVRLSGGLTNTGTMQFDQSTTLKGVIANQGAIGIADGKTVSSFDESCGGPGSRVIDDAGGSINATGSGTLSVGNYEQGGGTTSGPSPVTMPCGSLEYIGAGAGTIQIDGIVTLAAGAPAAGQTLRIAGTLYAPSTFTNAGTIALAGGTLSFGDTVTSSGRLTGVGTITGSVDNSGVVAPGSSPGTLAVNGGYTQGAGGSLEIEIAGTGDGQFDKLAIGAGATLGGTLAVRPTSGYAGSAALGDGIDFLTYGSSRAGQFSQVTTVPSLTCPKQFALDYADSEKRVGVDVLDGPFSCGGGGAGTGGDSSSTTPPVISVPAPTIEKKPIVKCKKGFRKVKAKGKTRCRKIKKRKKHRKH